MPLWLAILFGAVPGVMGLVVAFFRMGAVHNELKNIAARIEPLTQMASDIAYLKGIEDGKKQASVQALTEHLTADRRPRRVAAAG